MIKKILCAVFICVLVFSFTPRARAEVINVPENATYAQLVAILTQLINKLLVQLRAQLVLLQLQQQSNNPPNNSVADGSDGNTTPYADIQVSNTGSSFDLATGTVTFHYYLTNSGNKIAYINRRPEAAVIASTAGSSGYPQASYTGFDVVGGPLVFDTANAFAIQPATTRGFNVFSRIINMADAQTNLSITGLNWGDNDSATASHVITAGLGGLAISGRLGGQNNTPPPIPTVMVTNTGATFDPVTGEASFNFYLQNTGNTNVFINRELTSTVTTRIMEGSNGHPISNPVSLTAVGSASGDSATNYVVSAGSIRGFIARFRVGNDPGGTSILKVIGLSLAANPVSGTSQTITSGLDGLQVVVQVPSVPMANLSVNNTGTNMNQATGDADFHYYLVNSGTADAFVSREPTAAIVTRIMEGSTGHPSARYNYFAPTYPSTLLGDSERSYIIPAGATRGFNVSTHLSNDAAGITATIVKIIALNWTKDNNASGTTVNQVITSGLDGLQVSMP